NFLKWIQRWLFYYNNRKEIRMDVVIIGIYDLSDKKKISEIVSSINDLDIIWDFKKYHIDAQEGIQIMKKYFNILDVGVLIDKKENDSFSSYSLIYDISEFCICNNVYPLFFTFLDRLCEMQFHLKKMIIAFADEWYENTTVKIEKMRLTEIKKRLNNIFVWCNSYINLISDLEIRDDNHPLILEISC
nr:hypothetical protein [Bacteroidales bacterium]